MDNYGDDLYPLALLMDELKHDDVLNRVEAMQKVDTIAIALGPERTVKELLPFLNEVAQDDEEEVFAVLAEKLGDMVPYIGGTENCKPLILILTILALMEEPIVRDKAIDALNKISTQLPNEDLQKIFLPLITQLSQGNWFSKKVALCGLYKLVIDKIAPAQRVEFLNLYLKLVGDEYPMVRRLAALHLPELINLLSKADSAVESDSWEAISKMFQHIIHDDQDSVKFLGVDVLIAILEFFRHIGDFTYNGEFLQLALKLCKDESWRVRYTAADRFSKIAENFTHSEPELTQLIEPFIDLMDDHEGEVRKAIAKQLPDFCQLLTTFPATKATILSKIIPVVTELSQDPQENVRALLALTITGLSPILEKQLTIDRLLPLFLTMLRDDFPDVRLNIILNLLVVNDTIGINLLLTNLLPAITELAQDHKWRVRLAIIEYIPKLAHQLGELFFNDELLALCMLWLWDPVFAIRDAAVNNLKELTAIFGSEWATSHIILRITNPDGQSTSGEDVEEGGIDYSKFIIRITCLFAITALVQVVNQDVIVQQCLPFINNLYDDVVANIRFNVAKLYKVVVELLAANPANREEVTRLISTDIAPKLEKLLKDKDFDVRYFAEQTIDAIKAL